MRGHEPGLAMHGPQLEALEEDAVPPDALLRNQGTPRCLQADRDQRQQQPRRGQHEEGHRDE